MPPPSILISGAGIAGSTLAYWLGRSGFDVTVVERSDAVRSSGNPVDIRGAAMDVVERMGVLPALDAAATHVRTAVLGGPRGRTVARLPMSALSDPGSVRELEVPRADLSAVLLGAAREHARFLFGDRIVSITEDASGVDVTFERGTSRRFDLVIGADGQHSGVRRLAFGPDTNFVHPVGLIVATLAMSTDGAARSGSAAEREFVMFNAPGRSVSIHPSTGKPLLAFIFWGSGEQPAAKERDDLEAQKAIIIAAHRGLGWRVPELLEQVRSAPDIYFDEVSQIRISPWSRGRVALLGDAASSVTLLGEGSSLAIIGAATLAESIARNPGSPAAAFAQYEREHRGLVAPRQAGVGSAARMLVPRTRAGIAARNLAWSALPLINRLRRRS